MSPSVPGVTVEMEPFGGAEDHLLAEIEWLKLILHRQVLRLRAAGLLVENDFRGLYVADEQVDAILRGGPEQSTADGLNTRIQEERAFIDARIPASPLLPLVSLELDAFERQVLVACAASEVDLSFETLYAYVQNDVNRKRPTADLLLKMFANSTSERLIRRQALSSESALLKNGFIRAVESEGQSFLARGLRIDDRITDFLLGRATIDVRLRGFTHIAKAGMLLEDLLLPVELRRNLEHAVSAPVLIFCGPHGAGKRSTAQALSTASGRPMIVADLARALMSSVPLTELLSLLHREAFLNGANLYLDNCDALLPDKSHMAALQQSCFAPTGGRATSVFLAADAPLAEFCIRDVQPAMVLQFPVPSSQHRRVLWEKAIQERGFSTANLDVGELAATFALTGGQIYAACRSAAVAGGETPPTVTALEAGARAQSGHGLRRLAQKIEAKQSWADLILPTRAMQQLHAVSAAHKYRDVVYSRWGFQNKLSTGKGLNVLFFGPSGTGKTMAAGILAKELGLDIYKIDLSSVVSKYIGETEKQLSQIFREAQTSNAILFFDEADALFGKRSEVKDAHDRYANVETAYLLQKMEEYEGIVVLTTNFRKNIDDAFARRMHHIVEFPLPDAANRMQIWKGLIPEGLPLAEGVDFAFLSRQFDLAGGNIRNVVLAAAFLAAEDEAPVCMEHLILATAREFQKLGRLPSRSDFREYFDMIHV